tara:strand:- start:1148 stop:1402 length:255 start_codon:yes stop_codon:yes gene_type:complete
MRETPLTIKQLLRRSGVTLSQVATESETTVSDVSKILNENLRERVKDAALRLIVTQNTEVRNQLNPSEGNEDSKKRILRMRKQN